MNKNKFEFLFLIFAAILFISCSSEDTEDITNPIPFDIDLTLNSSDEQLSANDASFTLKVITSGEWTAKSDQPWCLLSKSQGTGNFLINGTVEDNISDDARTATITIRVNNEERTATVTQSETKVQSITISLDPSDGITTAKEGSFKLTLVTNSKWEVKSNETWCSLSVNKGTGDVTITCKVEANTEKNDRNVVLTITTSAGEKIDLTLTQKGITDSDGPDPEKPEGMAGRIEVPKLKGDDLSLFYTHDTNYNGKKVITYSFEYDIKQTIARWVAFTFNTSTPNNDVGRSNSFSGDPLIEQQYRVTGNAYKGSGYSRGHLVASSDRQYSKEANKQTFYMSNMNPQIQNGFNGGIWSRLEKQVQEWGYGITNNSDTLYLAKGGTIDGDNISGYIKATTQTIPIPKHFYMAILSLKNGQYKAIGFWFDHKAYGNDVNIKTCALSIDELEEKTGLDFFTNLPNNIQTEVERSYNLNDWSWTQP